MSRKAQRKRFRTDHQTFPRLEIPHVRNVIKSALVTYSGLFVIQMFHESQILAPFHSILAFLLFIELTTIILLSLTELVEILCKLLSTTERLVGIFNRSWLKPLHFGSCIPPLRKSDQCEFYCLLPGCNHSKKKRNRLRA